MDMNKPDHAVLFYIHDPMCSWCWGFRPTLTKLLSSLPANIRLQRLLGGLAPDTDQPMPVEMQSQLQQTWQRIQQRIPGTPFNFDFWKHCVPRRSTYPACRAVIAARTLSPQLEDPMTLAIQQAYYTRALNPSDSRVLQQLATELGLNPDEFTERMQDQETDHQLQQEIALASAMGARSFPSLILQTNPRSRWPIAIDYTNAQAILDNILSLTGDQAGQNTR